MDEGDKVLVMGVQRSTRVRCDSKRCKRDHSARTESYVDVDGSVVEETFRVHYEDEPREGIPGKLGAVVGRRTVQVGVDEATGGAIYGEQELTAYQEPGGRYVVTLDNGTVVSADKADVKAVK